ncbi:hypothetical protein PR048_016185 [Dryococelus australis]|uniref:Uncharacterized protein n=1 Tax=Dryococelus australis TaxID=614101 RepID=A0ABQ9HJ15_9NEOP|nr:hypothetical protein PR048_016185 [Dryococelus australis]
MIFHSSLQAQRSTHEWRAGIRGEQSVAAAVMVAWTKRPDTADGDVPCMQTHIDVPERLREGVRLAANVSVVRHAARERVELSRAKEALEFTCSKYCDMAMTRSASGGQAACMLHASDYEDPNTAQPLAPYWEYIYPSAVALASSSETSSAVAASGVEVRTTGLVVLPGVVSSSLGIKMAPHNLPWRGSVVITAWLARRGCAVLLRSSVACQPWLMVTTAARSPPTKTKPVSIPDGVTRFSQVGIMPDDAVVRRVFSGISRFPRPFISAPLHVHFNHPHRLSRHRC